MTRGAFWLLTAITVVAVILATALGPYLLLACNGTRALNMGYTGIWRGSTSAPWTAGWREPCWGS